MGFLHTGINNKPLKQPDKRKLEFSEFGIVKRPEPENQNKNMALDFAKNLQPSSRTMIKIDHEALIRNFGGGVQPEMEKPAQGMAPEIGKSFRDRNGLDHEFLTQHFGR